CQAPRAVKFLAHSLNQAVALHQSGARLYLNNSKTRKIAVISLDLIGSSRKTTLVGLMPLPGVHSHFRGLQPGRQSGRLSVPTYARVRYCDIYPGVDVDFYGDQGRLEYDFIVRTFADPEKIRIRWRGAATRLTHEGDLILDTAAGQVRQQTPRIYQDIEGRRVEVAGN